MYREKILDILPSLDPNEVRLVGEMVNNAVRYAMAVTTMDVQLEILPYRCSEEELREAIMRLDRNRKTSHDAFISRLKITNRIFDKHGQVFYEGPDDRASIGDCAFLIQREYDAIKKLLTESDS
jgi:hypothetical protein